MTTWEYAVIRRTGGVMGSGSLNRYGAEGWELVQVVETYGTLTGKVRTPVRDFIFKRPIES